MFQNRRSVVRDNDLALSRLDLYTTRPARGGGSAGGEEEARGKKGREGRTILSIPLGPSDVRTASLTAFAAFMLDSRTSMGLP